MNTHTAKSDPWYVVHTRTLKEVLAATVLREHLGLVVYLPEVRQRTSGRLHVTPLFPGYLFVQANLKQVTPSRINNCPGVLRLLAVDNQPQTVPAKVITTVRAGVERLNARGGLSPYNLQPGAPVRVKDGPFAGLNAIFVGLSTPQQRVCIFLEFLGGLHKVQLDAAAIESCAVTRPPLHKRGT